MEAAVEVRNLTRRYGDTLAVDEVSLRLERDVIHGLLGRNGAGKTTLMSLMTAQDWPSAGEVEVLGRRPHENEKVLPSICFVREDQRYIDDALAAHAFRAAAQAFPRWDQDVADRLMTEFRVPAKTRIKKMSKGQRSAVGVIIGIASRAEVTFFDEPYMGLDAVARQLFYDRLLADYAEHPRTIVLSSHLIDEIAHLVENVVVIDGGRIIVDEPAEALRGRAVTLVGRAEAVAEIAGEREVLHRESLGRMVRTTVLGSLDETERSRLTELDVDVVPVSLQQLVVRLTSADRDADRQDRADQDRTTQDRTTQDRTTQDREEQS